MHDHFTKEYRGLKKIVEMYLKMRKLQKFILKSGKRLIVAPKLLDRTLNAKTRKIITTIHKES